MSVNFRTYVNDTKLGDDYYKLRKFLISINDSSYHFGSYRKNSLALGKDEEMEQ